MWIGPDWYKPQLLLCFLDYQCMTDNSVSFGVLVTFAMVYLVNIATVLEGQGHMATELFAEMKLSTSVSFIPYACCLVQ
jgi:hypothetical protein